jgi:hypothetical protein
MEMNRREVVKFGWVALLFLVSASFITPASAGRADGVSGGVAGGPAVGSVIDGVVLQNPSLKVGDTFTLSAPFSRETCIGSSLGYRLGWSYLYVSINSGLASSGVNYTVRVEEVGPTGTCYDTPGTAVPSQTVKLKIISITSY